MLRQGGDPQLGPLAPRHCCQTCPLLPGLLSQVSSQPHVRARVPAELGWVLALPQSSCAGWALPQGLLRYRCVWTPQCLQHLPALQRTVTVQVSRCAPPILCFVTLPCLSSAHHPAASLLPRLEPSRDRRLGLSWLSQAPCSDSCHCHQGFRILQDRFQPSKMLIMPLSTQRLKEVCSSCKLWELSFV